jgi:hypothetical protein
MRSESFAWNFVKVICDGHGVGLNKDLLSGGDIVICMSDNGESSPLVVTLVEAFGPPF